MTKDPRVYLAHTLERAQRIAEFIRDGEQSFHLDTRTQDAVIRNFEVIGEASKRVPSDYRTLHPEIPWQLMAGFRDVLIHSYEGVDLARVWFVAAHDLPIVAAAVEAVLPPLEELEREIAGDTARDEPGSP